MYRFDNYDNSIVIEGFENGIAPSPHVGISDMRNVNIISVPGEASVNFATTAITMPSIVASVTSASSMNNTISVTITSGSAQAQQAVTFSGGSLPSGISAGTQYWIGLVNATTYHVYTDPDLANIVTISGTGTGTMTSTDMGTPLYSAHDSYNNGSGSPTGRNFMIDSNGRVWEIPTSGDAFFRGNTTLTNGNGNGLVCYNGYLFVFRNDKIDYMKIDTSAAWTYAWKTINTASNVNNPHFAYLARDNVVYYCDSAYIGSFFQKSAGTAFNPADATTYTYASQALALPQTEIAQCIAELGINLLVGGQNNAIYPWNRSATSYTYPILIADNNIARMVTVNTNTYIFAGSRGRIYITNGSQAQLYKKIPDHISGTVEPYYTWKDAVFLKNQLYFGFTVTDNSGNALTLYGGIWAIDLDTQALRLVNQLSYGTYGGSPTTLLNSAALSPTGTGLFIGWLDGSNNSGIDKSSGNPYTGSQALVESDLIPIGTFEKTRDMQRIEFKLSKPMVSGESVSLYQRLDFAQSYTLIKTFNWNDTISTGDFSSSAPVNFKQAQWLQIKAILNSTATTPSYVRLRQIRITGLVGPAMGFQQQLSA